MQTSPFCHCPDVWWGSQTHLYSSWPAVSRMSSRQVSPSITTCLRYESSIVGSYSSTKLHRERAEKVMWFVWRTRCILSLYSKHHDTLGKSDILKNLFSILEAREALTKGNKTLKNCRLSVLNPPSWKSSSHKEGGDTEASTGFQRGDQSKNEAEVL